MPIILQIPITSGSVDHDRHGAVMDLGLTDVHVLITGQSISFRYSIALSIMLVSKGASGVIELETAKLFLGLIFSTISY
jgi:hypothetical protein